jgi:hypothetical protein
MTCFLIYRVLGTDPSRIQQSRVINEQMFDSYAIAADSHVNVVRTSRRRLPGKESRMRRFTFPGTVISVLGFIIQFIGLRGMHC